MLTKTILLIITCICISATNTQASSAGNWSESGGGAFSMNLSPNGKASTLIDGNGIIVKLTGRWEIISKGKWQGYLNVTGKITSFTRNGQDVTPTANNMSMLFEVSPTQLTHLNGGFFHDIKGGFCDLNARAGSGHDNMLTLTRH